MNVPRERESATFCMYAMVESLPRSLLRRLAFAVFMVRGSGGVKCCH